MLQEDHSWSAVRLDRRGCRMPCHERLDAWRNLSPKARTVEDTIVPNTCLDVVLLLVRREVRSKLKSRRSLAAPCDVVVLTLHRHQSATANPCEVHGLASVLHRVSGWVFAATSPDGSRVEVQGSDVFTFKGGKITVKNSYRKQRTG